MNPLLQRFLHQFHRPHGAFGHVAGWMLAAKGDRARPLVDAAKLTPEDRVLDIGCGPGVAAALAAIEVPRGHVTAIDPSEVMVTQTRRRTRRATNVTVQAGTAEQIPLADDSIDVAWAINTFHHWADRGTGLAEVHRVLRPGGRFLVVEQDRHGRTGSALSEAAAATMAASIGAAGFSDSTISSFTAAGESHTLIEVARA